MRISTQAVGTSPHAHAHAWNESQHSQHLDNHRPIAAHGLEVPQQLRVTALNMAEGVVHVSVDAFHALLLRTDLQTGQTTVSDTDGLV